MSKVLPDRLSPHRPGIDHEVCLNAGETPTWGPLYLMSRAELVVLKEWQEENISKGFISQLSPPFAAPGLSAKKHDRGLRFCIHCQDINSTTIKNRYPLLLKKETLNYLGQARIYPKLDVRGVYNLLRVKKGDQHKLPFRTRYELFKPTIMQFGSKNAPANFQGYINNTIQEALNDFESAHLDDVLIYSDSEEEHIGHIEWIMQRLLEAAMNLKPEKCEFHKQTVRCLGLIISTKGISMGEDKVKSVWNWSREKKTKNGRLNDLFEVQLFLVFCNYY